MATKTVLDNGRPIAPMAPARATVPASGRRRRPRRTTLDRVRGLGAAVLWSPLRILSHFWPKDESIWLFGGCRGQDYADNARHFFQWMALNHPEIRCVWVSDDPELLAKLGERGLDCTSTFSREGSRLAMRAGVAVTSHGMTRDLHRFLIAGKTKVVLVGNGTPLARTGYDLDAPAATGKWGERQIVRILDLLDRVLRSERDRFDLVTVASEHVAPNVMSAWHAARNHVVVTGLARTDLMLQRQMRVRSGPRRVLYIPGGFAASFEHESVDALADLEPDVADAKLKSCDAELFVPIGDGHQPSAESLRRLAKCKRVHLFDCGDLHHHLDGFDAFATDGSNVFCDYLLLDRPILFFRNEELDAAADRGRWLYYDWEWLRCGPLVRSWDDFFEAIARALENPSQDKGERERVRNLFHAHRDPRNCQRIFDAIRSDTAEW